VRVPDKSRDVLRGGASVTERYGFIDAEYADSAKAACAPAITQIYNWLGASRSGFYDWRHRRVAT
jgi:hypothetical protein